MATCSFCLSSKPLRDGRYRIRLIMRRGRRAIEVATPFSAKRSSWSVRRGRFKPSSAEAAGGANAALDRLEAFVQSLLADGLELEEVRDRVLERLGKRRREKTLLELLEDFLEHQQRRVRPATMELYHRLKLHLQDFLPPRATPSTVRRHLLEDFSAWMLGQGYAPTTTNRQVRAFRTFLLWLERRGLLASVPPAVTVREPRKAVIYLTAEELRRIRELDLSGFPPGYEAARAALVVSCFTGARWSELEQLMEPEGWARLDLEKGTWRLFVVKTGAFREIPLVGPILRFFRERWLQGAREPLEPISNPQCGAYLKEIGEAAGITELVEVVRQRGSRLEREVVPKYRLLSPHVGRRTFISLALQGGLELQDLLHLSHDDLRQVRLYLGIDQEHRRRRLEQALGGLG